MITLPPAYKVTDPGAASALLVADTIEFVVVQSPRAIVDVLPDIGVYTSLNSTSTTGPATIGGVIRNVKAMCRDLWEKFPGLPREMMKGKIRLSHLLRARMWAAPTESDESKVLAVMVKLADDSKVVVNLLDLLL